jgi:hypothetical protein
MYYLLLVFVTISPLIGILLVENGEFALTLGIEGFSNGAWEAYFIFIFIFYISFVFFTKVKFISLPSVKKIDDKTFFRILIIVLVMNIFFLLLFLFGFGSYKVLTGVIDKGEFRSSLGTFGAISYLITKFYAPAILVLITVLYKNISKYKFLLISNFFLVVIMGASWGFKSSAIFMIFPALMILLWENSLSKNLFVVLLSLISILFFASIFDEYSDINMLLLNILNRLTIIQGDMSWYIWSLAQEGLLPLNDYYLTLLPAIGGKMFTIFSSISIAEEQEWIKYHYDLLLTQASGYEDAGLSTGHSVTGTVFSESIFALPFPLNNLYAVFSGLITAINYKIINEGIKRNDMISVSLSSIYFISVVFPWLNSGGIIQLFHIGIIFGIITTYILLKLIVSISIKGVKV